MSQRLTVTRTIRLSPDVDQSLQRLAKRERVSVNLLVNSALKRFTAWEAEAERFGFITVPASMHAKLYSYLTEEEAKEMGEWAGKNFGRDFILFWFKKISLDTVLQALTLLGSNYARIFHMEHSYDGRIHTVVVKHGWGRKGSIFNEEFLRTVFRGLLNLQADAEHTEDQVVIRVKSGREPQRPGWGNVDRRFSTVRRFSSLRDDSVWDEP